MIQSTENFVLCEIEKKFQDKDGGILIDATWAPEEYATLEGIVITAPVKVQGDEYTKFFGTVNKGDKIFFSYGVIFNYITQPDDDTPVYKNLIIFEGKEYWKVNMDEIFCVVTASGITMITDNILIEPFTSGSLTSGKVAGMPELSMSYVKGDTIFFEDQFVQQYNIFGKVHYIIPSRRVIAKLN